MEIAALVRNGVIAMTVKRECAMYGDCRAALAKTGTGESAQCMEIAALARNDVKRKAHWMHGVVELRPQ